MVLVSPPSWMARCNVGLSGDVTHGVFRLEKAFRSFSLALKKKTSQWVLTIKEDQGEAPEKFNLLWYHTLETVSPQTHCTVWYIFKARNTLNLVNPLFWLIVVLWWLSLIFLSYPNPQKLSSSQIQGQPPEVHGRQKCTPQYNCTVRYNVSKETQVQFNQFSLSPVKSPPMASLNFLLLSEPVGAFLASRARETTGETQFDLARYVLFFRVGGARGYHRKPEPRSGSMSRCQIRELMKAGTFTIGWLTHLSNVTLT